MDQRVGQADLGDGRAMAKRGSRAEGSLSATASDLILHVAVATGVFAGLLLLYGSDFPLHHDLAGSVLSGRLAVSLGDAFRDYSIYFPPAERIWFSTAARLGELTGLGPDLATVTMTGAAVLFGAGLAYRIRRETVGATPYFLIGSVAVLVILPILFKNVFGLREHLVALGLWPYLVLRISDPDGTVIGRRLRVLLGLWMGATLLFKYLYAVVVLLVELADALVRRRAQLLFRIENIVAGAVVFAYLFAWLGIDSSQRQAIGAMFSAIDAALLDPRSNWLQVGENLLFALFFILAFRILGLSLRTSAIGLALVVGAIGVAWAQERWSSHHMFPVFLAYLAWWWMAGRDFRWWCHAVVAFYLFVPVSIQFRSMASYRSAVAELDRALEGAGLSVAGKRIGLLNMHPSPYNQYLVSHGALRWNAMMNNAYVSSELAPFDIPENAGKPTPPARLSDPGRRMLHEDMLRLWEDMPPDALIFDRTYRWPLSHIDVDWIRVFSKDPRFTAILARYRPIHVYDGQRIKFTYYVRAD
jgi:hypothetical protein